MPKRPRGISVGYFIKDTLLEMGTANPSAMHKLYKAVIMEVNSDRPKGHGYKISTYWSFLRACEFARSLGLIEKDREAPIAEAGHEQLLSIRVHPDTKRKRVVPSARVFYRLTSEGATDEYAWGNLRKAYDEMPRGMERVVPRAKVEVVERVEIVEKAVPKVKVKKVAMTPDELLQKWEGKAKNIRLLRADIDKLVGYDVIDTEDAIAEYEGIILEDFEDREEYQEERDSAWQVVLDTIEDLEESL